MKNLILLFVMLFSVSIFSQGKIEWEKLPDLENKEGAEIQFQSKSGILIAFLPYQGTYMISKDNAKTWNIITFPSTIVSQKLKFILDETGEIYCYEQSNSYIYYLDSVGNAFLGYLTVSGSIHNVKFGNNNIYIHLLGVNNTSALEIYERANLTKTFSKSLSTFYYNVQIILGIKNTNYLAYEKDSIFLFKNDGSGFKGFKINAPKGLLSNKLLIYSSGTLLGSVDDRIYESSNGLDWVQLKDLTLPNVYLGRNIYLDANEQLMAGLVNKLWFFDTLGKVWKEVIFPTNSTSIAYENKTGQIVFSNTKCTDKLTFYISNDFGKTWKYENNLLDKSYSTEIFVGNDETVYAYACSNTVKTLTKNATDWKETATNGYIPFAKSFITPSGKWFAKQNTESKKDDFFTSSDNGSTWKKYAKYPQIIAKSNDIHKTQDNELIIFDIGKYFISKDEGETWLEIAAPGMKEKKIDRFKANAVTIRDGYIFFSNYNLDIYNSITKQNNIIKNIDEYMSFLSEIYVTKKNELCFVAYVENIPNEVPSNKLFFSKDYGKTFTYKNVPVKGLWSGYSFFIDADENFMLFNDYDMYISYDKGDNWVSMKTQFKFPWNFKSFVLSPEQYIYMINYPNIYKTKKKVTKIQEVIQQNINFSIFPNPTNESVEVVVSEQKEAFSSVYIYSIEGKLLNTERFEGKNTTLDVHALPSGMYFLQVKNGVKSGVQKLIVQH